MSNVGNLARWWIRSIHYLDFVNKTSQITQERLYSEERKGGRASGIMKEVAGQQKIREKQRHQRKAANKSKPTSISLKRVRRTKDKHKVKQRALAIDLHFQVQNDPVPSTRLKSSMGIW
jgi:hypothetical protein